ncbi:hypothetical protein [Streptomyces sp. CBMA29]|uniref:hypothetical protein n=1 Tax=Streptomyces sp. CBMA29 TaxID=1896314 RepID=UPI001662118B|nr:hypothetical protein [Streptomyces sp. CBMA29]
MAEALVVGEFHFAYAVGGRVEALRTWRVTTVDPNVAAKVARLLGGMPRPVPLAAGGGLEVVTEADSVRVVMASRSGTHLGFCLEGSTGIGRFEFSPAPWTLDQMTRTCGHDGATGAGGRDAGARLIIKRVEIRTLTGMYVVHRLPVLVLPAV